MPNYFRGLPLFSFEGAEFPWESYEIIGGIRDHIHEYPHTPGGNPEKMGRKLYEVKVTPIFQAGLLPERYARLFPDRLQALRRMFENQVTGDLSIPHIGTIKAYARSWTEKATSLNLSGVDVELTFIEDQSGQFGDTFFVLTNELRSRHQDWAIQANTLPTIPTIFQQINSVALQVLSIKDQLDLFGGLVAAKIEGLVTLIQEANSQVSELNDPDNYGILASLHNLLSAAVDLAHDVAGKGKSLQLYTVPRTMSITQVAVAVYGDATRAAELMQLNTLDNPLAIPAGTKVVYYA